MRLSGGILILVAFSNFIGILSSDGGKEKSCDGLSCVCLDLNEEIRARLLFFFFHEG